MNKPINTQDRIAQAAIECLALKAFTKITLNDIAKQAKVSRPTVYSYFKDSAEVLQYALLQSAYRFSDELIAYIEQFTSSQERILEAMLFCLKRFPEEPALALISSPEVAQVINEFALISLEGNAICQKIFDIALQDNRLSKTELNEVIEICIRMLLSLLTVKAPKERTLKQQRTFLEKRLLPAVFINQ